MDEQDRQRAIEEKKALSDLTESKGWEILCKYLKDQADRRINQILLNPLGTPDAEFKTVYQQEFGKGEVAAFKHIVAYPTTAIDILKAIIESTQDDHNTRDNDSDDDEPDAGFDPEHVV